LDVRILDVINKTTPFFEKHGIENPRLNIELLLAHLLNKKRLELYLEFERALDEPTLERLREFVRRRATGEPLQYIIGSVEFCGLEFAVDRRVLIPRPETEHLVEVTLEQKPQRIVDVGTGSGCIAVTLAKRLPAAQVWAIDSSADALDVARANAIRHGAEKNIRFLAGNLLHALPAGVTVDVVVSNPPYIASGELATLPKEVRDFEPVQALVAGVDGLEAYRQLIPQAVARLAPAGCVVLELGAGQRGAVERLLSDAGCAVSSVVKDLQGHERVIVARV
jgi:release factor glutamine methyltransferase